MRKSLLTVGLLTFSSLVFAAKSYDLTFVEPTKVAGVELAKGSYTVRVEGDKAIFKGHNKEFTVPVKIETGAAKKFGYTSVESSRKGGEDADRKSTRLNSSHLGSSYAVFCLKK